MEYCEMKACTFAPEIVRESVKQPDGPVVVKGLGRFLETRELARHLQEDLKCVCRRRVPSTRYVARVADRAVVFCCPRAIARTMQGAEGEGILCSRAQHGPRCRDGVRAVQSVV
jgi:hypothetical protein